VIGDEKETEKNLNIMVKRGLTPIPAFHFRGSKERLKDLSQDFDYIALGGLVPLARRKQKLRKWLDFCFSIIKDSSKVHGFGMTGFEVLKRYPWYSVDSTSWLGGTMRAEIYKFENGRLGTHSTNKKNKLTRESVSMKDYGDKKWFKRVVNNAIEWQKVEKHLTELWEKKGVVWDN
jgi:hypothetical protein